MIFTYLAAALMVPLTNGQTIGELAKKIPKSWNINVQSDYEKKSGWTFVGQGTAEAPELVSYYLGDTNDGYSNPKFHHCTIVECSTEVRCTDYARWKEYPAGEETECTFTQTPAEASLCKAQTRLNTYDYYYQWWATVDPRVVETMIVTCWQAF